MINLDKIGISVWEKPDRSNKIMEIGSEFWEACNTGRKKYFLSGRTALEYIIRDILKEHRINSVLLPGYCCHTMIEPFMRHGITVRFYDVFYNRENGLRAELPEPRKYEIFYFMTYFGFLDISGFNLNEVRKSYDVIIEDKTHSWLADNVDYLKSGMDCNAYYSYASFRKWTGFYGIAEAKKQNGYFKNLVGSVDETYSKIRKDAMQMKQEYMKTIAADNGACDTGIGIKKKESFLGRYGEAESFLEKDYVGYTPTDECLLQLVNADFDYIKKRRKENADILMCGLSGIHGCALIYKKRQEGNTPLFVPLLVENQRDALRKYLIENEVYCPVHWSLSDYHQGLSDRGKAIYGSELSIVCDQRYGKKDMERIVRLIRDYFNEGV